MIPLREASPLKWILPLRFRGNAVEEIVGGQVDRKDIDFVTRSRRFEINTVFYFKERKREIYSFVPSIPHVFFSSVACQDKQESKDSKGFQSCGGRNVEEWKSRTQLRDGVALPSKNLSSTLLRPETINEGIDETEKERERKEEGTSGGFSTPARRRLV